MMWFVEICDWLQATSLGQAIKTSNFLFPTIETVHVLALSMVVGSIAVVDLRLLGLVWRERSVTDLSAEFLPWTWSCYGIAVVAGFLLFTSNATTYAETGAFRIKFLAMGLAGLNMAAYHFRTCRTIAQWDNAMPPPPTVRLAGGVSLALWIAIVFCGRWIGYALG